MKIHSDTLTYADLYEAARIARVTFAEDTPERKGSRSRDHGFTVLLRGESNRAPNQGTRPYYEREYGQHAATWDQWGVFLAVLFEKDERMLTPYDKHGAEGFAWRTADRFGAPEAVMGTRHGEPSVIDKFVSYGWPADAHGDHTFRWNGTFEQQNCTKCEAKNRWSLMPTGLSLV